MQRNVPQDKRTGHIISQLIQTYQNPKLRRSERNVLGDKDEDTDDHQLAAAGAACGGPSAVQ